MRANDLDRLDRATLRAWRWSNLVGWGLAGAGLTGLVAFGIGAVTNRLALTLPSSTWLDVLQISVFLVPGVVGGILVGSRVYRSPGLVAFLGQQAVALAFMTWDLFTNERGQDYVFTRLFFAWLFSLVLALPAALAAMKVWRRRPQALRASP